MLFIDAEPAGFLISAQREFCRAWPMLSKKAFCIAERKSLAAVILQSCERKHHRAMNSPVTSATGVRAYQRAIIACFVFRQEISREAVWDFRSSWNRVGKIDGLKA